jgi:phage-related protein
MVIDEFLIAMGLKTDGVKKGAKEAENAISGMTSSIVAKLGLLSAAAGAALSIFSRFGEYVGQADAMGKLANALDVDIEKMHAWGEAAARAGGSVEGFQGSLQSLTAQLARQATVGTSRAAKMLEGVGIDAGEIGRQRQAFDVMMDLAEKAETMGKQEFFGLGRSLGLDQGTIMLLQQGRAALKEQIRLQKEFGVYTKEDAKLTADWNDRVADFGQVMKSFSAIIFRMILPAMTKFVEYVNKAVAFLRKHEKFVQAFFIGLAAVITTILLPALAKMAAAWLANPITWFVVGLTALALAIEDLVVWAEGGESALSDLWEAIFGSPEKAQELWADIKEGFTDLVSFLTPIFQWIKEEFIGAFKAVWPYIVRFVRDSKELIVGLKDVFSDLANYIIDTLGRAFNWVIDKWNAVASALGKTKIDVQANVVSNASDTDHGGGGNRFGDFITETPEADGGIFTRPTNALIGEAGAEAVIPFSPGKRNRGLELLSKIAGNLMPNISAANALPMGGASTVNNTTDTRVTVGTVNIRAADGTDAANQFMTGVETRAQMWTAAANVAY